MARLSPSSALQTLHLPPRLVELPVLLWCVAVLISPFPVFRSGLPQPCDLLYLLAIVSLFAHERGRMVWPKESRGFVAFYVAFLVYIAIVGSGWSAMTDSIRPVFASLMHVYNGVIALGVLAMFRRYGVSILWVLTGLPAVAMLLCLGLGVTFFSSAAVRQSLAFANPNQLGFFAIITCAQFFALPSHLKRPLWLEFAVLSVAMTLTLLSASRAAFVALVPLVLQVALSDRRAGQIVPFAAAALALGVAYFAPDLVEPTLDRLQRGDFNRGYDRLISYPGHLIFGAGEGRSAEFGGDLGRLEVHSLLGTIVFSYGLVGFTLFVGVLSQPILTRGLMLLIPLASPLVYGLTHNSMRQTEFWVLLSMLMLRATVELRTRKAARAAAPLPPVALATPHGAR